MVLFWPVYCFYFLRESSHAPPVVANRRIGSYYAAGATVVLIMAAIFWPWGFCFFGRSIALGFVVIVYFGAGPIVFHKTEGKVAVEHAVCFSALFTRSIPVVGVLPEPMSIVGQGHTTNLDWRQTREPFCEDSCVLGSYLRA